LVHRYRHPSLRSNRTASGPSTRLQSCSKSPGLGKPERLWDKFRRARNGVTMAPAQINVNSADINPSADSMHTLPLDVMGLFFFAYRDFVGDADALLERQ